MARPAICASMPSSASSRARYSPASLDVALALVALLGDQALDLLVLARVQRREREVLELPLDRVDTEAVRERRVDLERLARLLDLLLLGHRVDRAHVVQAVGELDQDDPHVGGHRHHHLAVVVRLRLVARLEGDAGELRHAVDDRRDLLAEALAHLLDRRRGVLDGVVQQRRAQRLGVQAHARADPRHADGVHDEVLARLAPLRGVVLAGEHERVLHAPAVDLHRGVRGVLGDDREQVAEQPPLRCAQTGRRRRAPARRPPRPRAGRRRRRGRLHGERAVRLRRRRPQGSRRCPWVTQRSPCSKGRGRARRIEAPLTAARTARARPPPRRLRRRGSRWRRARAAAPGVGRRSAGGGLRAAQHQARLADAVPLVDLEREGRLRRLALGDRQARARRRTRPPARARRASGR